MMTLERAKILEMLNDRKQSSRCITLTDLSNETRIFQYRKLKKILEGLKQDGYLSQLIIRDPNEPITYELTERGYNFKQEKVEEKKLWWHNNAVGVWTVILSVLLVACAIIDTIYGIRTYSANFKKNDMTEQNNQCYHCECCSTCNTEQKPV